MRVIISSGFGEEYLGQNLETFGGIGQPGRAMGGYFEGRLNLSQRLNFNLGLGDDHLLKSDRIPVELNRNTGFFANTIFHFTPEVATSLETITWRHDLLSRSLLCQLGVWHRGHRSYSTN